MTCIDGHVCCDTDDSRHPHVLSAGRCCTADGCTGDVLCRAPVHVHGCFRDVPPAVCTEMSAHQPLNRWGYPDD